MEDQEIKDAMKASNIPTSYHRRSLKMTDRLDAESCRLAREWIMDGGGSSLIVVGDSLAKEMIYYISRGLVLSGQGVHCTHLQDLHQAFTGERPDIIERLALISTLAILGWQESTPDLPVPFNPHDVFRVDWQMQKLLEEGTRLIVQMDAVDQPKWWTRSLWNSLRGTSYNQVTIIAPKSL